MTAEPGRIAGLIGVLTTTALLLPGCGAGAQRESPAAVAVPVTESGDMHGTTGLRSVSPQEFEEAVAEPGRVTINVHVPYEGEIPGTDLEIPYDQLRQQADRLPADRDTPLAVYCRTGPMSRTALNTLGELGFRDVVELDGGMRAWQRSGRELIRRYGG